MLLKYHGNETMKAFGLIKPYFIKNRIYIIFGIISLIAVDFLQLFIPRVVKRAVDDLTAFQIDAGRLGEIFGGTGDFGDDVIRP